MFRRRGRIIGILAAWLSCQTGGFAFERPDRATAPLGEFDARSRVGESADPAVKAEIRAGLAALGSAPCRSFEVRWQPATGRPRHLFTLDGRLSGPSATSPEDTAKDFLRAHSGLFGLSPAEIAEAVVGDSYRHPNGRTRHLVLQQRCAGLDVLQARILFALDDQGRVIQVAGRYWPGFRLDGKPSLSALEAVQWAAGHCERSRRRGVLAVPRATLRPAVLSPVRGTERRTVFDRGPFRDPVPVRLVIVAMGNAGRPAWEARLHVGPAECYHIVVDARDGSLLYRANLYKFAAPNGRVFREHPDAGPRELLSFEGHAVVSPGGWCDASGLTQGNNVLAREDADADDEATPGYQPYQADRQFDFPFTNAWADQQTTAPDAGAVVTNLFYATNWCHDYFYRLGFDEGSGNFQLDNFERGGLGGDRVHADALDGAGFNTSRFLTLPDGDPPGPYGGHSRVEIHLFAPQPPRYPLYRDADLDADVIVHEYTHGLTERLVGGPADNLALATLQAATMAEGWSDFFPCSIFGDPVVGEYITGNTEHGARHFAYDRHDWLLGHTGNVLSVSVPHPGPFPVVYVPEVHDDGEIWAAALWALREELGNPALAEFLIVEALRYTPPNPNMLDGRDAILLADAVQFAGIHRRAIWQAFARRGMGYSAECEVGPRAALAFQTFNWPPDLGGSFFAKRVVFVDNLEGDLSGWRVEVSTSGSGVAFHPTIHRAAGGQVAWYFGREGLWNYDTTFAEWSTLETPPITLAEGGTYYLEFKHWRSAEDGIDWREPPYYFDPGFAYVRDAATSEVFQVGFAFHNTNGWETRRIDVSRFAGRTVRVGFYFDTWTRDNNDFEGWYLDDVRVLESENVNTPPTGADPRWTAYP